MIVTRGLGRGDGRGALVAHGLTRRSIIDRIADALKILALDPMTGTTARIILGAGDPLWVLSGAAAWAVLGVRAKAGAFFGAIGRKPFSGGKSSVS